MSQATYNPFVESLIAFFAKRKMLVNFILLIILVGGVRAFITMPKNAWPNVDFDYMRVTVNYPGASPEDVERLVVIPIEELLIGLSGIEELKSTSSQNQGNIIIRFDPDYSEKEELKADIRTLVLSVRLPDEVVDEPTFFEVKTSEFSILDVGIYKQGHVLLDVDTRRQLQQYVKALEDQLLSIPGVARVRRQGFLDRELRVEVDSVKAAKHRITLTDISRAIRENNSRKPAGKLKTLDEARVSISSELQTPEDILNVRLTSSFSGSENIQIRDVATVKETFEEKRTILRINGYEGIYLRMIKGEKADAIRVDRDMKECMEVFKKHTLAGTGYDLSPMDDDSIETRNRLKMISINGSIGFLLILVVLFLFLNFESGFWVAVGIPFSFAFTLFVAQFFDITINNMTLAAGIIVMGMVVDDAIVVSEYVSRLQREGHSHLHAAIRGASFMFVPIIAAIITTCAAFFPLEAIGGRQGKLIAVMPAVIFLVLIGSLIESLFLLPAHLSEKLPLWVKNSLTLGLYSIFINRQKQKIDANEGIHTHWFKHVEVVYHRVLYKVIKKRGLVLLSFFFLGGVTVALLVWKMHFVLFPAPEVTQVTFIGQAEQGTDRWKMSKYIEQVENVLQDSFGKEVTAFRTSIANSRRGSAIEENKASISIEVLPSEERTRSVDDLIAEWNQKLKGSVGLTKKVFIKYRNFGSEDGSSIKIKVSNNDDSERNQAVDIIVEDLKKIPGLVEIEAERVKKRREFIVRYKRETMKRLQVNPNEVAATLRASLEGEIPVRLRDFDEEINLRVVLKDSKKDDIQKVLQVPVANQLGYLIPLKQLVTVELTKSSDSIERIDFKRSTAVFADLQENAGMTPLEVASILEKETFPKIRRLIPNSRLSFDGEIKETREASNELLISIGVVLAFILIILSLTFNSIVKALLIILVIPFGVIGVVLAYLGHGITQYGFFTIIGCIGLAGVMVNDAIILVNKFDKEIQLKRDMDIFRAITEMAETRLNAVVLTTLTTVMGLMPTAYGIGGYDGLVSEMMLAMSWGLVFATLITLLLIPCLYSYYLEYKSRRLPLAISMQSAEIKEAHTKRLT